MVSERSWGVDKTRQTLEGEEDEEGKVVNGLGGVADVLEETEVVVGAEGVVVVGHDVGEGEGNISTGNDLLTLLRLVRQLCEA
jgi:hypothetical protein